MDNLDMDETNGFIPSDADHTTDEKMTVEDEVDNAPRRLLYNVSDRTPIQMAVLCAFQQVLIVISGSLAVSTFVAEAACASEFPDIKTDLLSAALFMNGVTTLMMVTIGIRLPLFQGSCADYVVPLIAIRMLNPNFCSLPEPVESHAGHSSFLNNNGSTVQWNATSAETIKELKRQLAFGKLQEFQGCLILVGVIHWLIGMTGTVGFLLRFIGPITVVPTSLLSGIYLSKATSKFTRSHWGMAGVTAGTSLLLSLYLGHRKMPCPAWSRTRGFYIHWYPLHQVFAILIGIMVGWAMSGIMTAAGALTDDPDNVQYMARTDARSGIVTDAYWFKMPYPNQFGPPSFNAGIFIAFLIATMTSILDSIGDYYACARVCNVPPPPRHATNRGIAVEGFGSMISGLLGCGHATTTSGGNIGALGITKVASRDVFYWVSFVYIIFGLIGKISAVFITIPLPVLGGAMIIMFGMLNGIILSHLQVVSLASTRNLAVIGISLLVGLMVPYAVESHPDDINTGSEYYDNIIKSILVNPQLCGLITSCFLDNSVPGTKKERGITAWQNPEADEVRDIKYSEGLDVYWPLLPTKWMAWRVMKYLPFCLYKPAMAGDELASENGEKTVIGE